jgi:hypothetical protein
MLINTSQQIALWGDYFPEHNNANKLGILINMFNIGSIISFFITWVNLKLIYQNMQLISLSLKTLCSW